MSKEKEKGGVLRWLMKKLSRKRYERDYVQKKPTGDQKDRRRSLDNLPVESSTRVNFQRDQHEPSTSHHAEQRNSKSKDNKYSRSPSFSSPATNELQKFSGGPKYIALYDYSARTQDDLSINKDDILEVLADSYKGWSRVRSMRTNEEGYVPTNYIADYYSIDAKEWYFGNLRRVECEQLLVAPENKLGAFLVRDSESRAQEYSLSVKDIGNHVRHYRIRTNGDRFYINSKYVFPSIPDVIDYYNREAAGLCTLLSHPCLKVRAAPETAGLSYDTADAWEIPREQIKLNKRLGAGNFGEVYAGVWNNTYPVAVKTLKTEAMCKEDFLAEAQFLKQLSHPNLIKLYAVCTLEEPLYIVTELMKNGSLLDYLRGDARNMGVEDQIYAGAQVARGMSYLEEKNYIHRDLAARNVLVGEKNVFKVADFGLSRFVSEEEYVAREGAQFPIKWTAPEAITHNKFSIKSDIWSFGILLAEIITHGAKPYPGMSNTEVADKIEQGYRMPKPRNCPIPLYNIMLETWNKDWMNRPTFSTLQWKLEDFFTLDATEYREADEIE